MDGFVLILAIVVFSVFKNVIQEAKKKEGKKSLPDVLDTIAEHEDSQSQALEALRRWEARQRAGSRPGPEAEHPELPAPESTRIPRPGEHHTDVRFKSPGRLKQEASRQQISWRESGEARERPATARRRFPAPIPQATDDAGQTRREAYDAIRQLLDGRTRLPVPTTSEELPDRRGRRQLVPRVERTPERIIGRETKQRPRIQGTIARNRVSEPLPAEEIVPVRGTARGRGRRAPEGFERIDERPPLERAVLYAELLGKPMGLRPPGPGDRD